MGPSRSCSVPALLLSLLTLATLMASPSAYVFYVGGRDGWVPNPSESYATWASRNRFQVNDTLVFKYNKSVDSVLVVDKAAYDACNASGPVQRMDTGDDAFRFDRSGPFYFISGSSDRCAKGEKLPVVVLAVRNKPPAPSTPAAPVTSPSPSPSQAPAPAPPLSPTPFASPSPSPSPSPSASPASSPAASPATSPPASAPAPPAPPSPSASPASSPAASPATSPPASAPAPPAPPGTPISPSQAPNAAGTPTAPSSGGGDGGGASPASPPPPSSAASGLKASGIEMVLLLSMVIFLS